MQGRQRSKMHQRRCRILEGLSEDPLEIENSNSEIDSSMVDTESNRHVDMPTNQQDIAVTIPGILLPKKNEQWNLANDYLKSVFIDVDFSADSIDSINGYVNLITMAFIDIFRITMQLSKAT